MCGLWLPSEGVVSPFTLRQVDIGRQKHHTTSDLQIMCSSDTVETEFHFVMLCPVL